MNSSRIKSRRWCCAALAALSFTSFAHAGFLYWDTNGATAGSSNSTSGVWGTSNFWSTDPNGGDGTTPVPGAYVPNSDVVFSAGTIATGTNTITVSGAQTANSIQFEEGTVTLSGTSSPALTIGSGGMTLANGLHGNVTLGSSLGTIALAGSQTWTNSTTTTARNLTVASGVVGSAAAGNTHTLTIAGASTGTTTLSGGIGDGSSGGKLALEVNQTGTGAKTVLSAANAHSGGTTITAGTLEMQTSGTLGTGNVSIASVATLSFAGATYVVPGVVSGAGNVLLTGSPPRITMFNPTFSGTVTFSGSSGNPTLILAQYGSQTLSDVKGTNTFPGILLKTGTGTLTYAGTNGNTSGSSSFATRLNGGTLLLDYAANNTNKLAGANQLTSGGGTIVINGGSFANDDVSALTLESGGATLFDRPSGTSTLRLNAITFASGSTVNLSAAGIANCDNNNANGILSRITVGGADWATTVASSANDASINAYSAYSPFATSGAATNNERLFGSSTLTADTTKNSLKLITTGTGQSLDLGGFTLTAGVSTAIGAVLFVGADDYAINNGTIRAGGLSAGDLVFHHWGAGTLTVNANVGTNSGNNPLVKTGSGLLVLTAANTYKGTTYVTGGKLSVSSNANLGDQTVAAPVFLNAGTLQVTADVGLFNGTAGTNNRNIALGGGGGTIEVTAANTLSVYGTVNTSTLNATAPIGSLIKTGTGTLVLNGTANYTGPTAINAGTLRINSSSFVSPITTAIGGTLAGTGTLSAPVTIENGGTVAPGNSPGTLSLSSHLILQAGGNYNWQVYDATGAAGTGYDTINITGTGTLNLSALSTATPYAVNLWSLSSIAPDVNGPALNWDPTQPHAWTLVSTTQPIADFDPDAFVVYGTATNGTAGFANPVNGGTFTVALGDNGTDLMLHFTPAVPEPASLAFLALGALAMLTRRHRDARTTAPGRR